MDDKFVEEVKLELQEMAKLGVTGAKKALKKFDLLREHLDGVRI